MPRNTLRAYATRWRALRSQEKCLHVSRLVKGQRLRVIRLAVVAVRVTLWMRSTGASTLSNA
nr:MAG TPA: hypothetical protein [Caudoviricetes sp.]